MRMRRFGAVCRNQILHQCKQKISDELGPEKQGPGVLASQISKSPGFIFVWTLIGLLRPERNYYQHDMESWKRCLSLSVGGASSSQGIRRSQDPSNVHFAHKLSALIPPLKD